MKISTAADVMLQPLISGNMTAARYLQSDGFRFLIFSHRRNAGSFALYGHSNDLAARIGRKIDFSGRGLYNSGRE